LKATEQKKNRKNAVEKETGELGRRQERGGVRARGDGAGC